MLFTFKRDEEGRERIYVGDVCVWMANGDMREVAGRGMMTRVRVEQAHCDEAIERADEAGFWHQQEEFPGHRFSYLFNLVTVDVHVADNAVLSVTREGDES